MKKKNITSLFATRSSKILCYCGVSISLLTAVHAADVNTTGGTTVINTDVPGNKYLGNGTLQISADGGDSIINLGSAGGSPITEFAMTSGGLITIDSGVTLRNGGFSKGIWTNNFADLTINGTLDLWDGNPVRVDALNGSGSIVLGLGNRDKELRVGVDGGSGTFSGNIAQANGAFVLRLYKEGAGTQTFNGNLSTQIPRQYIINGGAIDLSSAATHSMTSQFLGAGNFTKSGAGALTIHSTSGALLVSGTTNVTGGSLGFGSDVSARANLVAATGTTLGLNFTGQATVGTLNLGGSGPLAAGVYDSSHATYGSYFTGTGQLNVLNGAVPTGNGTWSSTSNGFWNVSSRWTSGAIANGSGSTATINAASAVTVTLDSSETVGHLSFQGANHTLSSAQTDSVLTLAGTTPSVTVATGLTATINANIAGTSGLAKEGAGTLTFGGGNKSYTGGTAVNGGRLILPNIFVGNSTYSVASGATLQFDTTGTDNRTLAGGTISGSGNFVKSNTGRLLLGASGNRQNIALDSGALIDVQGGLLRNEFGNNSGSVNGWLNNKADLNVASGAFFDTWDGSPIVDAITGSGTINKGWNNTTTLTFGVDNGSGTFTGTISRANIGFGTTNLTAATFNLVKNGTGTQTFSGDITAPVTVAVNTGALLINGNATSTSNTYAVNAGATLGGTGTLTGAVTVNNGSIAPGSNIGTLYANNGVTWNGGANAWKFELGASNAADKLAITGAFTKGSGSVFEFDFMNSNVNGTFDLVSWTTSTTFNTSSPEFTYSNLGGGRTGTFSVTGNTLQFTAVPEASNLLIGGLIGLGLMARRRKQA